MVLFFLIHFLLENTRKTPETCYHHQANTRRKFKGNSSRGNWRSYLRSNWTIIEEKRGIGWRTDTHCSFIHRISATRVTKKTPVSFGKISLRLNFRNLKQILRITRIALSQYTNQYYQPSNLLLQD